MIRFTCLQFRAQAVVAAGLLVVLAIALAVTGPQLAHLYATSGLAACPAHGDCASLASAFLNKLAAGKADMILYFLGLGVVFIGPAIIGMFWGAPLIAREFEARTLRLAWSQGVTRNRWLAVKLGVVGLASMATAGLLSLMLTWWSSPLDRAGALKGNDSFSFGRLAPVLFATRGITPVGYAAFAFALGAAAGVLIRRIVPAMGVTLAGFAIVQLVWPNLIRPHLVPPVHATVALTAANISSLGVASGGTIGVNPPASATGSGAWVLSTQTLDRAGHLFNVATVRACQGSDFTACQAALGPLRLRDVLTEQPVSRFWALQWYETGLFILLAAALAGFCAWWLSRRRVA